MSTEAAFWNALAERYAAKPVDNPDAFERKIAVTNALMTPQDVVLDFGCGTGSLALILAPHAAHVHGLDLSSEMMRIARGKALDQGIDNVTFHTAPFDDAVPFEPGSLDGVCAYSILHLVEDLDEALVRTFDLVKPGGWFVSSTVTLGGSWVPYRPIIGFMRMIGKAPRVAIFDKDHLADATRRAGFVDLQFPDVGAGANTTFMTARKPG
jgi:arsenite methyltransferase